MFNLTLSAKSMNLYELNKKLPVARQNDFIFNQINKLTIKIYGNLSHINVHFYPKHPIPIMHRHFLGKFLKIQKMFKLIVMIKEILFILHVVNGFHIIIHIVDIV